MSVWDVTSLLTGESEDNLLKETEWLVNEARLLKNLSGWTRLLRHLWSGEIDKMELREDDFVSWLDTRAALNMKGEEGMGAGWGGIQIVLPNGAT